MADSNLNDVLLRVRLNFLVENDPRLAPFRKKAPLLQRLARALRVI